MTAATHSFVTTIACPTTDDPIKVEVAYRMLDQGVLPERNWVRVVIVSVIQESKRDDGAPYELLSQLDSDTMEALASQAASHWQDEGDLDRYGHEST